MLKLWPIFGTLITLTGLSSVASVASQAIGATDANHYVDPKSTENDKVVFWLPFSECLQDPGYRLSSPNLIFKLIHWSLLLNSNFGLLFVLREITIWSPAGASL